MCMPRAKGVLIRYTSGDGLSCKRCVKRRTVFGNSNGMSLPMPGDPQSQSQSQSVFDGPHLFETWQLAAGVWADSWLAPKLERIIHHPRHFHFDSRIR